MKEMYGMDFQPMTEEELQSLYRAQEKLEKTGFPDMKQKQNPDQEQK